MVEAAPPAFTWLRGLASGFLEKLVELAVLVAIALFLFPLFVWAALLICAVVVVLALIRKRFSSHWKLLAVGAGIVCVVAILNVLALTFSPRAKYVVAADDLSSSFFVKSFYGPRGRFYILPLSSYSPPKRWLFRWIADKRGSFVFIEAERSADGYIVHSPSEVALARLAGPDGQDRRRWIFIPRLDRDMIADLAESLSFKFSASNARVRLSTDVGKGRPGLFGFVLKRPPTLDEWRRVAYFEELLLNLPAMETDHILAALEQEGAKSSELRDVLRLAVFRLELIGGRYQQYPVTKDYIYNLAPLGNLRQIAESINEANPGRDIVNDPWFWSFKESLNPYMRHMPRHSLVVLGGEVETGARWVTDLMARAAQSQQQSSLLDVSSLDKSGADSIEMARIRSRIERIKARRSDDPKALSEILSLTKEIMLDESEDSVRTGDAHRVQMLQRSGRRLVTDEIRQWVRTDKAREASRAFLVYEATRARCNRPFIEAVAGASASARTGENPFKFVDRKMQKSCAEVRDAVALFPEPLQRQFIEGEFALEQDSLKRMAPIWQLSSCGEGEDEASKRCLSKLMLEGVSAPFAQNFIEEFTLRCGDGECSGVDLFERNAPVMGARYSGEEFLYSFYIMNALLDGNYPQLSPTFCRNISRDFSSLVEENRFFDRLTVLNLHLAVLERCKSPQLKVALRILHNNKLPVATWYARVRLP